ncbi:MAG: glycosyltransferase family 4 protein [Elusimicrobia bacterium]|nr:glycosyltransferase family 4 protein [Candidatus Obscuribacterium magneticum]
MKLAFLLNRLDRTSGISRVVASLTREFSGQGHEVHLYASHNRLGCPDEIQLPSSRVFFHWLPSLRGACRIWSLPFGAKLIPSAQYDLVISHTLTMDQDVIVMHNDPQQTEFEKLSAAPFRLHKPILNTWKRRLRTAIEKRRFRPGRFKQVIALSKRSAVEISNAFGIPPDRIAVIPHGVDSDYFSFDSQGSQRLALRESLGFGPDQVVFLYIGEAWKGLEFALRALGALSSKRVGLLVVGLTDSEPLRSLAKELNVHAVFQPPRTDVREFYRASDVFLLPTPLDTFDLCVLEAMSMGLPVLVSQYAGASELLTHGRNGWVVNNPFNQEELASLCQTALSPDERAQISAAARGTALQQTWKAAAQKHLAVYQAVARESRANRPVFKMKSGVLSKTPD